MTSQTIFEQNVIKSPENSFVNQNINLFENIQCTRNKINLNLITRQECENLVKNTVSPEAQLINYKLQRYSKEKLGFLGAHLRLIVETRKSNSNEYERKSFFVKTIPFDVPTQATYIKEKGVFQKEITFFKDLVPLLMKNFKGDDWAPQCYLTKECTIVFEDMKLKGFSNRSKLFDKETLKSATSCIARFHASSLLTEERLDGIKMITSFMKKSIFYIYENYRQISIYTKF
jgi:hypothetical protein